MLLTVCNIKLFAKPFRSTGLVLHGIEADLHLQIKPVLQIYTSVVEPFRATGPVLHGLEACIEL